MGVTVSYLSSIALLALAAAETPSMDGMGDTTTYFDTTVLLTMFLLAGRYLEAYSKTRTADAITELGKLRPTEALVLEPFGAGDQDTESEKVYASADEDLERGLHEPNTDDSGAMILEKARPSSSSSSPSVRMIMRKVSVDQIEVGDIVRVPHGASPPADGIIATSEGTLFDESSLTGESRPVKKDCGDQVFVGTMNRGAMVDIKVSTLGGDTM
jgi:cation transport ATPase